MSSCFIVVVYEFYFWTDAHVSWVDFDAVDEGPALLTAEGGNCELDAVLFLLGYGDESKEDEGGQDVESLIQHNVWFINDKYDKG